MCAGCPCPFSVCSHHLQLSLLHPSRSGRVIPLIPQLKHRKYLNKLPPSPSCHPPTMNKSPASVAGTSAAGGNQPGAKSPPPSSAAVMVPGRYHRQGWHLTGRFLERFWCGQAPGHWPRAGRNSLKRRVVHTEVRLPAVPAMHAKLAADAYKHNNMA
eukprot:52853-Chlamydomonas_euryale.AAC.7